MISSTESKYELWNAGRDNHDALKIVNQFYRAPIEASDKVYDEYWSHRVCILAERIVAAEKELAELKKGK